MHCIKVDFVQINNIFSNGKYIRESFIYYLQATPFYDNPASIEGIGCMGLQENK